MVLRIFHYCTVYAMIAETLSRLNLYCIVRLGYRCASANEMLCNDRFKIQDDEIGKDDLAAWACIRLDRLRSGFRFVHLLDAAGAESKGVLLVRIEKSLV